MSNVRIFTRINKSRQVTPSLPLSSEEQLPVINPNPTGQAIRHNSTLDKNGGDVDNSFYGHNTEDIQDALEGSNLPSAINVFATMDDVGGGGGGGSQVIDFSTIINMTGNFKSRHIQTGPIAYTKGSFPTPLLNFGNETRHYVTANGTGGQPTFSSDFVLQMNTWSNNIGDINQIIHQGSPSGKILVWVDNVELA